MSDVTAQTATTSTRESNAERLLANPSEYFDFSYTEMHSIPRSELEGLQLEALRLRFGQHRETIPMVAKLANRQEIDELEALDSAIPLLFEHTMYKSYPISLLERQRYDELTAWLNKLTAVELSGVDTSNCDSIDSWLDALATEAGLDTAHSSGTTGTMSFFPWSTRDLELRALSRRISELQEFGSSLELAALESPVHYVGTSNRHRFPSYMGGVLADGSDAHLHIRRPDRPSADLLWLGSRLRLAAARGDGSRVVVPVQLLERRAELERSLKDEEARDEAWLAEVKTLQGELVLWSIFVHDIYAFAKPRVERGERWSFAPGSALIMAGGTKGHSVPDDWRTTVRQFLDMRVLQAYGMIELSCWNMECEQGRYHLQPWLIPYVLDPTSSVMLPRSGSQRGRAAFFDLLPESHWGGLITGDMVEIEYDRMCGCGRSSVHIGADISRLGSQNGGDDKITCAATPEAYAEAMDFLVGY